MDCLNSNNKELRFTVGSKKLAGTVLSAKLVPSFWPSYSVFKNLLQPDMMVHICNLST